jgi:SRSO17 transposase
MRNTELRDHAVNYVRGLLEPVERKNSWQLAEQTGYRSPYAFQRLLGRGAWDAGLLRDELVRYVGRELGARGGTLVLDETGFLKKGDKSAGVARQYSGTAGKIENCQIGVFLAYANDGDVVLIDRALFLPKEWTEDPERCAAAAIPPTVRAATKAELGQRMLERAFAAGYEPTWVAGDEVYGRAGYLRRFLQERHNAYVLAIASNTPVWHNATKRMPRALLDEIRPDDWVRMSCGDGSKGERIYDWAWISIRPPPDQGDDASGHHALMFRRPVDSTKPGDIAYYSVYSPRPVTLQEAIRAAGSRWQVERGIQGCKSQVGLDDYEVRSWAGWHRHITLAMLAYVLLVMLTRRPRGLEAEVQEAIGSKKKPSRSPMAAFRRSRGLSSP